jgi:hypothetical protein
MSNDPAGPDGGHQAVFDQHHRIGDRLDAVKDRGVGKRRHARAGRGFRRAAAEQTGQHQERR